MPRTYCKYCKKRTHLIDHCPTIICKQCNQRGHPTWLCKQNMIVHEPVSTPVLHRSNLWDFLGRRNELWADM